jgi:Ser-tRNA(Ala) deacylase AlaX
MLTRRLFWEDPYATRTRARVIAVRGHDVEVDRTVFFAFSGGQESDTGTIGGAQVTAARLDGDRIVYSLSDGHGLEVDDEVEVQIDWVRRYRLMRLHFAAELVLETVCAALPGVRRIGAHIAQDKARIDFAWPHSVAALLPGVSDDVARIIRDDLPIHSAFSDRDAGRRYWEVAGVARVPCGGTHLRRTGEVGHLVLRRNNPGKGKERIEIYLAS